MRSKHFIGLILIAAIVSAIYFFRDELFSTPEVSSWDFVPNSAAIIFESEDPIGTWNKFIETDHWKNLSAIEDINKLNTSLTLLDSILGKEGVLDDIVKNEKSLVSLHIISSTTFDFVFYVSLNNPTYQEKFLQILDYFKRNQELTFSERTFGGQTIQEVKSKEGFIFSYVLFQNEFAGSFSPFLIEDVIRVSKNTEDGFRLQNAQVFNQSSLEFDAGNIYINLDQFAAFVGLFVNNKQIPLLDFIRSLGGAEFLDIEFDSRHFYLNGFLFPQNADSYLSVFNNQSPVEIDFEGTIPENTSFAFYQSFSDPSLWHKNLSKLWSEKDPNQLTLSQEFVDKYNFDMKRMLSWMNGHLVTAYQESIDAIPPKLIVIGTKDRYESMNQFNKLVEKANEITGDTLYNENYSQHLIYLLNIDNFPEKVFGPWYNGFPQSYFTSIDDYFILSDDIEVIKTLISNRDEEFTWKQSINTARFLEQNLQESNIGIFINIPRSIGFIQNHLSDHWKIFWNKNLRQFRQLEMVGIQYSNLGDRYYSSILLNHREDISRVQVTSIDFEPNMDFEADTFIIKKPKVVRNHIDNSRELLIQDINNKVYLVNRNGNVIWEKIIDGNIKGEISQIDYFKNRKLQYLFATDSSLYVIDREGELVDGFPVQIGNIEVDFISVIDYDRSRNYRFMISGNAGNTYLFDNKGDSLKGWNPKVYGSRFNTHPFHLRVRSKDVFLAILENGLVHVTNRRGEMLPGFPLDLDVIVSGDVFNKIKGGFKETIIELISNEGELISFNLEGTVTNRVQFYKPSVNSLFSLIKEATGKSFVIARQDFGRFAIVDKNDNVRFEKDFPVDQKIGVQYYNFGSDQELFVIQNVEPGVLLVYDGFGTFKSSRLPGDFPVSIIHHRTRREYSIYTSQRNHLLIYSLNE